jgi:hypothetical protein
MIGRILRRSQSLCRTSCEGTAGALHDLFVFLGIRKFVYKAQKAGDITTVENNLVVNLFVRTIQYSLNDSHPSQNTSNNM